MAKNSDTNNENISNRIESFSNTSKYDKKDIDAIKNRGSNTAEYGTSFRKRNEEEESKPANRKNELGEKEKLEKDDGLKENKKEEKKDLGSSLKDKVTDSIKAKSPIAKAKQIILKAKLIGTLCIIGLAIGLVVIVVGYLMDTYGAFVNAITTFFGISETDPKEGISVEDSTSLFQSDDYLYNKETGEVMDSEELVTYLKENNSCNNVTFWTKIGDFFKFSTGTAGVCEYLRYIETEITKIENANENLNLDRSLIISTIFYGYGAQANYSEMDDPSTATVVYASNFYESLNDALKNGTLTKDDINNFIKYSYMDTTYTTYEWTIKTSGSQGSGREDDPKSDLPTSVKGICTSNEIKNVKYNLKKWNVFMRFGTDAADIYESETIEQLQESGSSNECKGTMSNEELIQELKSYAEAAYGTTSGMSFSLDSSVNSAASDVADEPIEDLKLFEQAASTEGHDVDKFDSYYRLDSSKKKVESSEMVWVEFDYKNGYLYKRFPAFEQAINNNGINIEYFEQTTPKIAETIRTYIVGKKPYLNDILLLKDMDNMTLKNANTEGSVIVGANCVNYLSAAPDAINVTVKSCDGVVLGTYSMKEYITGVAFREVSNKEDDYVKAEMVAAMSFLLKQSNNNTKGNSVTIRSGNCAQAFCPMSVGCHGEKSGIDCGGFKCTSYIPGPPYGTSPASSSLISTYESYYEETKDFIITAGDDENIYNVHYYSSTQNEWYAKASSGMSFTQIIQETYPEATLIQCLNSGSTGTSTSGLLNSSTSLSSSNKTEKYPNTAPDLGDIKGFSYSRNSDSNDININPTWTEKYITDVETNCEEANWNERYSVNISVKDNYEKAFASVCNILKNGIKISSGETCKYNISDLSTGSTFYPKETTSGSVSDTSYGITQDWNYNKSYSINGKIYTPYSSTSTLSDYLDFVNALGGNEESCGNVNYILYKYAYKDAGFVWGGNNGRDGNSGKYNGMHYRINY